MTAELSFYGLAWQHHCREGPSRWRSDFQTSVCVQAGIIEFLAPPPTRYHQLYSLKKTCETMLVTTCWCNHNWVRSAYSGKAGEGKKNTVKSWALMIPTVVLVNMFGRRSSGASRLPGKKHNSVTAPVKSIHAYPIRKRFHLFLFSQVCIIYDALLYLTHLSPC